MKKTTLLLSILFFITEAYAQMQPGTSFQSLIDVTTNSPDVASLGKFGNVPVSYATGVPSISIPLYEINVGGIKLPISLDYHAGGIRVDETASSVGLGWALSGIGVISRQMVGPPDETGNGLFYAPIWRTFIVIPVPIMNTCIEFSQALQTMNRTYFPILLMARAESFPSAPITAFYKRLSPLIKLCFPVATSL